MLFHEPRALVSSQKYTRYVPKIPQNRTHSYYPCHKMSIGRKSLTNLLSEMIFLHGKHVFYIFLPSTPPY
jgi:hypothetical protein